MNFPTMDELNLLHANICQAFADPKRILIIYALHEQERHVSALANYLNMPQPTVSRHLRVLRQRSLVTSDRRGTAVYYRVANERIIDVLNTMRQILRETHEKQNQILA